MNLKNHTIFCLGLFGLLAAPTLHAGEWQKHPADHVLERSVQRDPSIDNSLPTPPTCDAHRRAISCHSTDSDRIIRVANLPTLVRCKLAKSDGY